MNSKRLEDGFHCGARWTRLQTVSKSLHIAADIWSGILLIRREQFLRVFARFNQGVGRCQIELPPPIFRRWPASLGAIDPEETRE